MAEGIYRILDLVDDLFGRVFQLHPLPRSAGIIDRLWFGVKAIVAYGLYAVWAGFVVAIAVTILTSIWAGIPVMFETFISSF